jgi:hypothetical protein
MYTTSSFSPPPRDIWAVSLNFSYYTAAACITTIMNHHVTGSSILPADSRISTVSTTKMSREITNATALPTENHQLSVSTIEMSNNMTDATTASAEREQSTCHSHSETRKLHDVTPADPQVSMDGEEMDTQAECLLFKLPPELRNAIYAYTVDRTDGQYGWVEDHDGSRISLLIAKKCAPSNELLRTCRLICSEGRGIFVQAQRDFWSKTTFTLGVSGLASDAVTCLDNLRDE